MEHIYDQDGMKIISHRPLSRHELKELFEEGRISIEKSKNSGCYTLQSRVENYDVAPTEYQRIKHRIYCNKLFPQGTGAKYTLKFMHSFAKEYPEPNPNFLKVWA